MYDKMLTTKQAAKIFGVHPNTIKVWAAAGQIPYIKTPGGHYRFPESKLLAMVRPPDHPHAPSSRQEDEDRYAET